MKPLPALVLDRSVAPRDQIRESTLPVHTASCAGLMCASRGPRLDGTYYVEYNGEASCCPNPTRLQILMKPAFLPATVCGTYQMSVSLLDQNVP
eukprot:1582028-Rhodomonas_salina.1